METPSSKQQLYQQQLSTQMFGNTCWAQKLNTQMLGTDVCYAPILDFQEAVAHPHNQERNTFVESDGVTQAAPAPRFSRTEPELPNPPVAPGSHSKEILAGLGMSEAQIAELIASGAVA